LGVATTQESLCPFPVYRKGLTRVYALANLNGLTDSVNPRRSIRGEGTTTVIAAGFTIGWPDLQENALANSGMFTTTPLMR
jgi:hypothetical protein